MLLRNFICVLSVTAALLVAPLAASSAQAQTTPPARTATLFAAASLKNALDEAAAAFTASTGDKVVSAYAASSALAKQIEAAAPADIFISADTEWMDYLARKGLLADGTRKDLLANSLVLIAPISSTTSLEIGKGFGLVAALGDGRLAVGDVKAVPAGKYAKAALESLGVWTSVENKLAPAENVRAALALVAQGEAPLGIVYKTDAASETKVRIVGEFPATSHPPIVYPIALTKSSAGFAPANALVSFLQTPAASAIFAKHGFIVSK